MSEELDAINSVRKAIQPDGTLWDVYWFLSWNKEENLATLDGAFSSYHLRAIADYMDNPEQAIDAWNRRKEDAPT